MCLFFSLNIYGAPPRSVSGIAPSSGDTERSQSCPQEAQSIIGRTDNGLLTISLIQVPKAGGVHRRGPLMPPRWEGGSEPSEGNSCSKLKAKEQGQFKQGVLKQQRPQAVMVCLRQVCRVKELS